MTLIDTSGLEPFADLIKEVYGDLAKPGVQNVGIALSAVLGLGITLMWPIMWANERAKIALENNLELYRERLKDVPPEQITVAPPEVAMPVLEKLGYVTNDELKKLYIELLAKASIKDLNNQAHPSFVNIINNLSPDEARLLDVLIPEDSIPFIRIRLNLKVGGIDLESPVLIIPNLTLNFLENLGAYISNLVGVGLLEVKEETYLTDEKWYAPHMEYFEKQKTIYELDHRNIEKGNPPYEVKKGIIKVTKLGYMFFKAIKE
ncbi:DUF4393 domain-containing protein [Acinetobacter seifertii]|uniref:DUF4393 domain-containing protein n=1 Tax=Acinetobacter seifertii TaxID=1530123 RepID=UPI00168D881F|nr:DUF4393 domain-containing protein [Acinetobacter seifertii]MDV7495694.1 DUF4393 domain-containing protein [Acinetobacter baumannii]QNW95003.1 DUF4393 domain-containing protein [Acinetobacter seifertii]QNX02068.1 DUF4393 domain-containing protein [Acinetobacter seifertii]